MIETFSFIIMISTGDIWLKGLLNEEMVQVPKESIEECINYTKVDPYSPMNSHQEIEIWDCFQHQIGNYGSVMREMYGLQEKVVE